MSLHLSADLDWAPDYVLEDFYNLLSTQQVPITLFATHESLMVRKLLALPFVETAVHPNLHQVANEEASLDAALELFPQSRGVRFHRLYYHSGVLGWLRQRQQTYLSNDLQFLQKNLTPYYDWAGMIRLPIYWEDDVHALYFKNDYNPQLLQTSNPGLQVLNFHPIHIYLNTQELSQYTAVKSEIKNQQFVEGRRRSGPGIRTLFLELIKTLQSQKSSTLLQVANNFSKTQHYQGHFKP